MAPQAQIGPSQPWNARTSQAWDERFQFWHGPSGMGWGFSASLERALFGL